MPPVRYPFVFGVSVLVLASLGTSKAAMVFGSLNATVVGLSESGSGDAPDSLEIGQAATIEFSHSSDVLFTQTSPTAGRHTDDLDLTIRVTIGGLVWEASDGNGLVTVNNDAGGSVDRIVYEVSTISGAPDPVFDSFPNRLTTATSESYLSLVMEDTSAPSGLLSSLGLPTNLSDLDLTAATFSFLRIQTEDPSTGDRYQIDLGTDLNSLTLVPEPTTPLLLGLAGGLSLAIRRRR